MTQQELDGYLERIQRIDKTLCDPAETHRLELVTSFVQYAEALQEQGQSTAPGDPAEPHRRQLVTSFVQRAETKRAFLESLIAKAEAKAQNAG